MFKDNRRPPYNSSMSRARIIGLGAVVLLLVFAGFRLLGDVGGRARSGESVEELKARIAQLEASIPQLVARELSKDIKAIQDMNTNKLYPVVQKLPADKQLRILVTGGAGFVGSNLVDILMYQGHQVTVLDNFFTGRRKNVEHWVGHPNFHLVVHDVVKEFMIEVDQIYHLACPASPPHYQYNPIKTIKTSTQGTLNMLGLAQRTKARLLFSSTSEVYGDPEEHPQKETYWGHVNPIGPRACYDEGKRVAETMCYSYAQEGNVEVRVARIFNTYGPRMHPDDGRVVSNFIIQALKGEDLTVYGEGEQTRSFQFVSDLVNGLIKLMNSNYSSPVNVGNPVETTILDFAKLILEMIPESKSKINYLPQPIDDPQKRKPDISRAKVKIGWEPKVAVRAGLKRTIEYFKSELGLGEDEKIPSVWISEGDF